MKRALVLAQRVLGSTSPNPAVGAVIVKDGYVVGEGATNPPGGTHAEIVALKNAGSQAKGATLYTTLEPCNFYNRTPPCTTAIIQAEIKEVQAAALDPNPKISGGGKADLEAMGIPVYVGQGSAEVSELYEAFAKHVKVKTPFVTAKFAVSLDGKMATSTGHSQWITGPSARSLAQDSRRTNDAIMVGINTILRDNPRLTARGKEGSPLKRQPIRVILDSNCRTPVESNVLREVGTTIIATTSRHPSAITKLRAVGAEVLSLPPTNGLVNLEVLLKELGLRGVVSLFVEGGGTVLGSLFDLKMVDKVMAFIAPIIIGGKAASSPVEGSGAKLLSHAIKLRDVNVERIDDDLLVKGYPISRS